MSQSDTVEKLTADVAACTRCRKDPAIGADVRRQNVFCPLPGLIPFRPDAPVRWILVCMEPSAGWADSTSHAKRLIAKGFLNFDSSSGDFALRYAAERWLAAKDETVWLTDLGRCAISGAVADTRDARYRNCLPYLEREIALFQPRGLVAVGGEAEKYLHRFAGSHWPPRFTITHYSSSARGARTKAGTSSAWDSDIPTIAELEAYIRRAQGPSAQLQGKPAKVTASDRLLLATYRDEFAKLHGSLDIPRA